MKTVMKKIFSLMLVAVLLVSAVPFAASAKEVTHSKDLTLEAGKEYSVDDLFNTNYSGDYKTYWVHQLNTEDHGIGTTFVAEDATYILYVVEDVAEESVPTPTAEQHTHDWAAATCTTPKTCKDSACGATEGEALGHDWTAATCTTPKTCSVCGTTEGSAVGHNYGNGTVCSVCNYCKLCKTVITSTTTHPNSCPNSSNYKSECAKCGEEYITVEGHDEDDCAVCWVCYGKGDTGVRSHKTADHCAKCGNTDGTHKTTCEEAVCSICNGAHDAANCPNNGDYDLKIYATMWTGDGREETVYLGTFYNLTTNTKISAYMKDNSARIHEWVAAKCSDYEWRDGKIYENKYSSDEIEYNDRMGYSDQEAYINVKRDSKDVVLFLHTARTYVDHDWIKIEGKTTNDTLTLEEAQKIVKKYYNFSSLKMYSNDRWNEYVDGNNNIDPENTVTIGAEDVTKIHILMSGASSKTSSGTSSSSTADSSNPKTGDEIFAPVMVLGTSVSALAVLFFLNKKRAY